MILPSRRCSQVLLGVARSALLRTATLAMLATPQGHQRGGMARPAIYERDTYRKFLRLRLAEFCLYLFCLLLCRLAV
eukprot:3050850-Pleurochrysis_carterae.AAC.6